MGAPPCTSFLLDNPLSNRGRIEICRLYSFILEAFALDHTTMRSRKVLCRESSRKRTPIRPPLQRMAGRYCLLASPGSSGSYYHWSFDALNRLSIAELLEELHFIGNTGLFLRLTLERHE